MSYYLHYLTDNYACYNSELINNYAPAACTAPKRVKIVDQLLQPPEDPQEDSPS